MTTLASSSVSSSLLLSLRRRRGNENDRRNKRRTKEISSSLKISASCDDVVVVVDVDEEVLMNTRTRRSLLGQSALLMTTLSMTPYAAYAAYDEAFPEETRKMITMTRDILEGKDYDRTSKRYSEEKLREFEEYRAYWFEKYQYKHGKSFYGYANTWNAQAKVGAQISMANRDIGGDVYPNGFDPESTAYNKPYLLKILKVAEDEVNDYEARNAF